MSTFLNRGAEVIPGTQESGGYSFFSLIRAAAVRWKSAFMLALLLGGGAAAGIFVAFPAEYTATALIKFRFNDSLLSTERGGSGSKEDLENQQRTQVAFIRSNMVLEEAVKSDPKCLPVNRLSTGLKTNFSEGTPVMAVSLSGLEPEALSRSVNAVAEVFSQQFAKSERNELQDKSRQLDVAISESLGAILKKKGEIRRVIAGQGEEPKVKVAEAALSAASIELTRTELEVEKLTSSIRRLRDRLDKINTTPVDQASVEEAVERLPQMLAAQESITKLESTEAEIRLRLSSPDVPQVKQAVEATNRARENLKKIKLDLMPKAEALVRRRLKSELAAQLAKEEDELIVASTTVASLTKRRDLSAENSIAKGLIPSVEMTLEGIKQDEDVLRTMRHRREELRIEIQSGGVKVMTFKSEIPTTPNLRPQLIKTGLAGIVGFVIGWLLIGIIETHSRRVRDGRVLAAHTGLRILGVIPAGATAGPELLRPQDMALCVAADQLRTSLQLDDRLRSRRTLLVSSATESEGKSTLALLLAGSLARAGFRTLLIDADLRNPTLTTRLGVALRPGLSESLTLTQWSKGRSRAEEAQEVGEVEEIEGLPLGLIQAGANGQAAATRLARADLRAWFASLRKNWEYIIIDSPPLLPVPDAAFLGKAADGLVLCARVGVSQVEQVNAALEHVNALGIDCLGIVMNDVRGSRPSYYSSGRVTPEALVAVPVAVGGGNT